MTLACLCKMPTNLVQRADLLRRECKLTNLEKPNGSIITHGREWPLYGREENSAMVLFLLPEDDAEKTMLDQTDVVQYAWE